MLKTPHAKQETFPLSYGQQSLWFLYQGDRSSNAYNVSIPTRIKSPVDVVCLKQAFQGLIDRHPSLRTTFTTQADGSPVQVVHPNLGLCFNQIDATGWSEEQLNQHVADTHRTPFALEQGPIFRVTLYTYAQQDHILLLTLHHIVYDVGSHEPLLKDAEQLYLAAKAGTTAPLVPLAKQYSDYVAWQTQTLAGPEGEKLWNYWQENLSGNLPTLDLLTDRPRPLRRSHNGNAHNFELTAAQTEGIKQLAQAEGTTPYAVLMTVFQTLLHRYTGQSDILVGSPMGGRSQAEFEQVVGYFLNPVAIRGKLTDTCSFKEFLGQISTTVMGATEHQDYPYTLLVERLQPNRDPSRTPIFQVFFNYLEHSAIETLGASLLVNDAPTQAQWANLELESVSLKQQLGQFDLTLEMIETQGDLVGVLKYSTDLFNADTIERMAGHIQALLDSIITNPDQSVQELPMLTPAERQRLLKDWNNTATDYPADQCIHQLVEIQAAQNPEAVALIFDGEELTYGDLNKRSNQLAHHLQSMGVEPDGLVGFCVERSLDMVVGLLGILKAGGCYVPIDPAYPNDRIAYMVEASNLSILLTQQQFEEKLAAPTVQMVSIDTDWETIARQRDDNPTSGVGPDNLAYIIYTSGSTGKPKGVQICHRSAVNFLVSMGQQPGLTPQDTLLAVTTISFDIAVLELYLPLITGARVVLASRQIATNAAQLSSLLAETQTTIMQATPATWQMLLAAGWQDGDGLKMLCGGEPMPRDMAGQLIAMGGEIWNMYGPTETTVWSAACQVKTIDQPIPVAGPIANTQLYILPPGTTGEKTAAEGCAIDPLPIGIPGEVHIGGDGLARGYLNRPDLTSERFIHDPFSDQPGARLYKTGDLARYRSDGTLEFLGRIDNQVKVRGFRIELGEIETALEQLPQVHKGLAIVREDNPGDKRIAAYLILNDGVTLKPAELRQGLRKTLPDYMMPSIFVGIDAFPLTPNGKIDRRALPKPDQTNVGGDEAYVAPQNNLQRQIVSIWKEILNVDQVGIHDNFFDLGGHSILVGRLHSQLMSDLEDITDSDISVVDLFTYPTINSLIQYLGQAGSDQPSLLQASSDRIKKQKERVNQQSDAIAIIGMACRFPGAKDIHEFWHNLSNGVESISFFSDEELEDAGIEPAVFNDPNYVKAAAILDGFDLFDAKFFGMTPREAEIIDPQQRLFMECAWHALEDAGYPMETGDTRIGVYAGVRQNNYRLQNIESNRDRLAAINEYQIIFSNDKDYMPTRVSYKLGLTGPSLNINTACSTSLVAVQTACQSLQNYQCDIAIAGAAAISKFRKEGYLYKEGMILSPDGHCRAFDADAQGTVLGDGVGTVVLKRLDDAVKDGDHIYAVIKGAALNNDGSQKIGFTAPSVEGQAAVIAEALAMGDIDPTTVTYIETHGTGTTLGDPIEMTALKRVYYTNPDKKGYCAIGSVKTNIGHTDTTAGMAGLIKTALALKHKTLAPHLHYKSPNPKLDLENSPFYVNTELSPWETNGIPRRAGVSSFGIGGTNAHIVLEEGPQLESSESSKPWKLLPVSTKTRSALDTATANLADYLRQNPDVNLADVAYTLQVGRKPFNHRRVILCQDTQDAINALDPLNPKKVFDAVQEPGERPVTFMFSGQGSQYVNMAQDLYQSEPVFRAEVDRCAEILLPHLGLDLRQLIYPDSDQVETSTEKLKQTSFTQPALFTIEYSLAMLWQSWGVTPKAMIGHSIGEYVAACLAGVFALEDALALVTARGQMMQQLPGGSMLSVPLPEAEILPHLGDQVSLAVINGPSRCVVAGPHEAIDDLEQQWIQKGVDCSRLRTSHAFHSAMMEPILDSFRERVNAVQRQAPEIPFISNVTGMWITPSEATDPSYWVQHLRQTVRFAQGLELLLDEPDQILLEVGPGKALTTFALQHPSKSATHAVLSSTRHPKDGQNDTAFLYTTLGKLWAAGGLTDWAACYGEDNRQRLSLPTYPFERKRHWLERRTQTDVCTSQVSLSKKANITDWFYSAAWQSRTLVAPTQRTETSCMLIFADTIGLGAQLASQLRGQGHQVTLVKAGKSFSRVENSEYVINPTDPKDYIKLMGQVSARHGCPQTIIHSWSVQPIKANQSTFNSVKTAKEKGFYSLLYLVQALESQKTFEACQVAVVSNGMQTVTGNEMLSPEKSLLLGVCKVIPQESPKISCSTIDVVLSGTKPRDQALLVGQLLSEIQAGLPEPVVAYRDSRRWIQTFEPVRLPAANGQPVRLREKGVYLISGGLGSIGLIFAEYLAKTVQAKLVLTSRSQFPEPKDYESWLSTHDENDPVSRKIRQIQQIEELGAEVLVVKVNVGDLQQMKAVVAQTKQRFGAINGVIHAAGLIKSSYINTISKSICEQQLQPKVDGLLVLDQVLKHQSVDFCLLMSSISTILGGLGFATYAAANTFMDTFTAQRNIAGSFPWLSVNWDAWQHVNWDDLQQSQGDQGNVSVGQTITKLSMSSQEGVAALERILSQSQLHQVVVSTGDLQARVDKWVKLISLKDSANSRQTNEATEAADAEAMAASDFENDTERTIANIWQNLLGMSDLKRQDSFFDLGGDSLIGIQVAAEMERQLGQKFPINRLFQTPTIAAIAEALGGEQSETIQQSSPVELPPCIVPLKSGNADLSPLFLVHAVGTSILFYQPLVEQLQTDRPVYGIQSVLLDGFDEQFNTLEALAAHYVKQIKVVQPKGPYFVAGPSFGGFLSYEIAQQLIQQGDTIEACVLIDRATPEGETMAPVMQRYENYWKTFLKTGPSYLIEKIKQRYDFESSQFRLMFREQQYQLYRKLNLGTDRIFNDAIYCRQVQISNAYQPKSYPSDIWVIRADELYANLHSEEDMGWTQYVQGEVKALPCPGGHMSIFEPPYVEILAKHFATILACTAKDDAQYTLAKVR
ncbi:non-ribosomal peptide synthetase/type I polyketide synthase [Leptothoe sp. PORK10 BA2]|uniref:non-ribosomal peptide synthetase/type I polyketide synthase n=1 Tax=Leptothoe sp. PORK10 BA2 TaxID=3110254 RepID=UPI002B1F8D5E|nr:non-ribosomal peptide synthetase/type I polyketide synthase [Leptothoe sp. PORK10 BA2]MEA5465540.1 amino acid adenylation domain-containing protein [Leptothoe sp. PORK10 BA2]